MKSPVCPMHYENAKEFKPPPFGACGASIRAPSALDLAPQKHPGSALAWFQLLAAMYFSLQIHTSHDVLLCRSAPHWWLGSVVVRASDF